MNNWSNVVLSFKNDKQPKGTTTGELILYYASASSILVL
jgi:hypothetical protein